MRIPYPERIPLKKAAYFALALFIVQAIEGTALYFCIGSSLFILLATLAFNAAGGLTRTGGAYIFSYSLLVVIVGLCYKAYLGQPAQSNLTDPVTDIEAYVASIAAMYGAVVVSRRFAPKRGLLEDILPLSRMNRSSVGCIIFGSFAAFAIALLGASGERLQTAFAQLNQLIPLGIIIGVMYEIRRSDGNRSVNLYVLIGAAYTFFLGATGFSKQGMLEPFVCWLFPVCALRFRLSALHLVGIAGFIFITFYYLVPFSQYGRDLVPEDATLSDRVAISMRLVEHPETTRQAYLQTQTLDENVSTEGYYYGSPQGFWDRLEFISVDDPLIKFSEYGHYVGFGPVIGAFVNAVPRVIWPNKPYPKYSGNYYAHELGGLAPDDDTTGISFSPTGEAFHIAGWTGIFAVAPLLWFVLFFVFDSLLGDLRSTPWGLLAFANIAHIAPEGGLSLMIHLLTFGAELIIFSAVFATWVAPPFAMVVLGAEKPSLFRATSQPVP